MSDNSDTLKEILKWTRFVGTQQLRQIIGVALESETEKLAYEYSDGTKSTRDIAKLVGLSSKTSIERYWEKWSKLGIVVPTTSFQGRVQRLCSLEDLGIAVPKRK